MNTLEQIKKQALHPEKTDSTKPCLGIIVPPSPFVVPAGWEFVLKQPFEGVSYIATVTHNTGYKVKNHPKGRANICLCKPKREIIVFS